MGRLYMKLWMSGVSLGYQRRGQSGSCSSGGGILPPVVHSCLSAVDALFTETPFPDLLRSGLRPNASMKERVSALNVQGAQNPGLSVRLGRSLIGQLPNNQLVCCAVRFNLVFKVTKCNLIIFWLIV